MVDVGGRLGRDERGRARKTTQQVNTARWGLQEPVPVMNSSLAGREQTKTNSAEGFLVA